MNSQAHTNYTRALQAQFQAMATASNVEPAVRKVVDEVIDRCRTAQKFMLPDEGELLRDEELRALSDDLPLRLPHKCVALEFRAHMQKADGSLIPSKRVVFCQEDDEGIYIRPAAYTAEEGVWLVRGSAFIPNMNYLDRSDPKRLKVRIEYEYAEDSRTVHATVKVVLGFLNALSCSNVRVQASAPRKAGKKVKTSLPFDTYHVLTIDPLQSSASPPVGFGGTHRSPREHLRRGHVRRLVGRRIWVNAVVVAAGRSAGVVAKDYALRARPSQNPP